MEDFFSWRRLNGIIKLHNPFNLVEIEFMDTIYKLEWSIYKVFKHNRKKEIRSKKSMWYVTFLTFLISSWPLSD